MIHTDADGSPVRAESKADKLMTALTQVVALTEARGEDRLPKERELAEQLGVSRPALREGLSKLESLRMVAPRQGSGLYIVPSTQRSPEALVLIENVAPLTARSIGEAMHIRALLETETAQLAAQNHERAHLDKMEVEIERLAASGGVGHDAAVADQEFHRIISIASGNNTLAQFVDLFLRLSWRRRQLYFENAERGLSSAQEHRHILEAIRSGDPAAARAAIQSHLHSAERFWAST